MLLNPDIWVHKPKQLVKGYNVNCNFTKLVYMSYIYIWNNETHIYIWYDASTYKHTITNRLASWYCKLRGVSCYATNLHNQWSNRFSAPGPFTCASTTSPICGTCRHGLGRYQEILKAKLIENTLRVAMAYLRVIPLRRYCLLVTLTIAWNPSTSGESESFSTSTWDSSKVRSVAFFDLFHQTSLLESPSKKNTCATSYRPRGLKFMNQLDLLGSRFNHKKLIGKLPGNRPFHLATSHA